MWMARQQGQEFLQESAADCGQVTVDGPELAVALAGERRQVGRWLPGGYHWTPRRGESVLVVKSGAEGEACLLGVEEGAALSLRGLTEEESRLLYGMLDYMQKGKRETERLL